MIPPSYADLGKKARDLFSKGYNYGFFKIDGKTKANAGVEFSITGSSNHENGKLAGNLESKYKWAEYGLTLTEKWTTESNLETGLSVEDQLVDGLKLTLDTQFSPRSGRKGGQVKSEYKREYLHTNFDVDFDSAGPTLSGAAVAGHLGWLIGGQFTFDTSKNTLTRNNVAVGYVADEFALHANVNDGTEFSGSVYHSIHKDLEFGVQFSWSAGANVSRFAVGTRYSPGFQTTYRAKVNNASQVGLSYQHKVRPGLALTLSALVEAKTFNQGGHKIGLGLELE